MANIDFVLRLGCLHDNEVDSPCRPKANDGSFHVMAPYVHMATSVWSSCSKKFMTEFFEYASISYRIIALLYFNFTIMFILPGIALGNVWMMNLRSRYLKSQECFLERYMMQIFSVSLCFRMWTRKFVILRKRNFVKFYSVTRVLKNVVAMGCLQPMARSVANIR